MGSNAPIAFFAYKRPEHTRRVLESLAKNKEIKESELYFFIDGPKSEKDRLDVEKVIDIIQSFESCRQVHIEKSEMNRGCANQIIRGVTQLCSQMGKVIVLEDDILVSPYFLEYMNQALELYAHEDKIKDISAYMYPVKSLSVQAAFMRGGGCWGWGTWQRAWKSLELDGKKLLDQLFKRQLSYEFNYRGTYDFIRMLEKQAAGQLNVWAVRWYATMFLQEGLTLFPAKSLTQNIGFDGGGTHAKNKTDKYDTDILKEPILTFPKKIEESEQMLKATMDFFKYSESFKRKLTDKIKGLLNRICG